MRLSLFEPTTHAVDVDRIQILKHAGSVSPAAEAIDLQGAEPVDQPPYVVLRGGLERGSL